MERGQKGREEEQYGDRYCEYCTCLKIAIQLLRHQIDGLVVRTLHFDVQNIASFGIWLSIPIGAIARAAPVLPMKARVSHRPLLSLQSISHFDDDDDCLSYCVNLNILFACSHSCFSLVFVFQSLCRRLVKILSCKTCIKYVKCDG